FRAIMEGVAYGTAVILQRMAAGGVFIDEIIACGGATKSDLWMQITADVVNKRILIPEEQQATSLGSAIAATVAAGIYGNLNEAADNMVRMRKYIEPNPDNHEIYKEYVYQYMATYEHLKDDSKRLVSTLK
ncbi:MAG: FGGY-family carbohydrate kinase, partial [Sphaerochaetaceae bacterium]|nr:FGGY-family carbohydrate kinase [Sphaerochaetaceae bacterium]